MQQLFPPFPCLAEDISNDFNLKEWGKNNYTHHTNTKTTMIKKFNPFSNTS